MAFDPATRDRFLAGALLPAAWVNAAQKARRKFHDAMAQALRHTDVILAPTVPVPAPPIGGERRNLGLYTQPFSAVGLPVVAVPLGTDAATGLPVGIQVVAAPWREDLCLRVAAALEATGLAACPPVKAPA
jgi:Asp-tRNA(Asn)/Glu-tRNA(Gln) amidotransferase A subunit family amidase